MKAIHLRDCPTSALEQSVERFFNEIERLVDECWEQLDADGLL